MVLGSGQGSLAELFRRHARAHPDRVAVRIGFDAALSQRIYSGGDAFLAPSRFEPCGLGQMIAPRSGSVPIARAIGGLSDTVQGYEDNSWAHAAGQHAALCERARQVVGRYGVGGNLTQGIDGREMAPTGVL